MAKFEIGTYVIPNENAHIYSFTGPDMLLGKVVGITENTRDIVVKVLKHKDGYRSEGREYPVISRHFDVLTEETLFDMMIRGDIDESNYESNMKLINNT